MVASIVQDLLVVSQVNPGRDTDAEDGEAPSNLEVLTMRHRLAREMQCNPYRPMNVVRGHP